MANVWVKIPLLIDRKQRKQDSKNDINKKELSGTLDSYDEGEIKAKYKPTATNMESRL